MAGTPLPQNFGQGNSSIWKIGPLINNDASIAQGVLRIAVNVSAAETITIGDDVYVFDTITTSLGQNTAAGQWNNTTPVITATIPAHGRVVGDLLAVASEIARVNAVIDANTVQVTRGWAGTTIATHANGVAINKTSKAGASYAAGGLVPVGLLTTLTPAAAIAALVPTINAAVATGETHHARKYLAITPVASVVLIVAQGTGNLVLATTETMAGSGNAFDAAAMSGGSLPTRYRILAGSVTPSAVQVTAGAIYIPHAFNDDPSSIIVQVRTSAGVAKAWDGAITVVAPGETENAFADYPNIEDLPDVLSTPGYLVLDNSGTTDWAATDVISYLIAE